MLVKILLEIILIIKVNFNFSSTSLKREGFPKLIEVYEPMDTKRFQVSRILMSLKENNIELIIDKN